MSDTGDLAETFVGFSYADMEHSVRRFESSLRHGEEGGGRAGEGRGEAGTPGVQEKELGEKENRGEVLAGRGPSGGRLSPQGGAARARARPGVSDVPHGYAESIVRARLSREQRDRHQSAKTELGSFSEERYRRSRAAAARGVRPFTFQATQTKASAARAGRASRGEAEAGVEGGGGVTTRVPPR
jgi:hypothetical protein